MEIHEMKDAFLKSAVHVVARDGLEKATTKAIAKEAGLNEAYIYKCYSGKDELLNEALHMEDANFADLLHETLPIMHETSLTYKQRCFILWKRSWEFILEERDDCIFYIRFYFSALGIGSVYHKHLESYRPLVEKVRHAFRPNVNIDMVIHQIFSTMLFFASRVMDGDLEQNEATTEWVFEQIYCFIVPNIRPELLTEKETETDLCERP